MALFAIVVQAGSLTAAAQQLDITTSAVSQHLKALEQSLGIALLYRTTRRISLTEAGVHYYAGCSAMIGAARSAQCALERHRVAPGGWLHISAPASFASVLAIALAPLSHIAGLGIRLCFDVPFLPSDATDGPSAQSPDMALGIGTPPQSQWLTTILGPMPVSLCAAPSYLRTHGWPQHPRDLQHHTWLGTGWAGNDSSPEALTMSGPGDEKYCISGTADCTQHGEDAISGTSSGSGSSSGSCSGSCTSQALARHAQCLAGWGIALLAAQDNYHSLESGRLMALLPDWRLPEMMIYARTPHLAGKSAQIRLALTLLADHIGRWTQ